MNREHVMSVLYDITMVIGGEISVRPLLIKTLQRLLYHTSYPTGLLFLDLPSADENGRVQAHLEVAIGDFELAGMVGQTLELPAQMLLGPAAVVTDTELLAELPCERNSYRVFLRLPIPGAGVILLMAPREPHTELPLSHVFQPVMANLAKAILLCRNQDAMTAGLVAERDSARQQLAYSAERLQRVLLSTIQAIAITVEKRDPYTAGHQQKTAQLVAAIAAELGWPAERIEGLRLGAIIHDIGKIYVPAEILSRPGKLTDSEFKIIKSHPLVGYDIIKDVEFPWPVAQMILQHHERLDGSGYPNGLKGEDIIPEARLLAVADVMEAMASHRPYRPAKGLDAGLAELKEQRGRLYEPEMVDACIRVIQEKKFMFEARGYTVSSSSTPPLDRSQPANRETAGRDSR